MKAYRIDRFGSVDGIVLRSSEDPRPGPKEILMGAGDVEQRGEPWFRSSGGGETVEPVRPWYGLAFAAARDPPAMGPWTPGLGGTCPWGPVA
jgi:hypothetical protein